MMGPSHPAPRGAKAASRPKPAPGQAEPPQKSPTPAVPLPPLLDRMIREGRLLHGLCLEGEPGLGKKTLAVNLAAALLCRGAAPAPCGDCTPCRKVLAGVHPDVVLVDGQADPEAYKMAPIRRLLSSAWLGPSEGAAKVFILADLQVMERDAQNLLLKSIEEPPAGTYFILTCHNRYRLLPTILSRVATVPLPPLSREECVARLARLVPGRTPDQYDNAWRVTGGSPGQGARLLTDPEAAQRWQDAQEAVAALARGDAYRAIVAITPYEKNRAAYAAFLETAAALAANRGLWPELGLTPALAAALGLHLQDIIRRSGENAYLPVTSALFGGWHGLRRE